MTSTQGKHLYDHLSSTATFVSIHSRPSNVVVSDTGNVEEEAQDASKMRPKLSTRSIVRKHYFVFFRWFSFRRMYTLLQGHSKAIKRHAGTSWSTTWGRLEALHVRSKCLEKHGRMSEWSKEWDSRFLSSRLQPGRFPIAQAARVQIPLLSYFWPQRAYVLPYRPVWAI